MIRFGSILIIFDLFVLVLGGYPVFYYFGAEALFALMISLIITTVLGVASYYPFTRIKAASMNRYMTAMLAGMMIRMVFIGLSVAIVYIFTEMHQISFTVGLLFSYICKSVIETIILTRKVAG